MKDGEALLPNGLQAAHNTDGYEFSSTNSDTSLPSTTAPNLSPSSPINVVFNEDDCVAITSGIDITARELTLGAAASALYFGRDGGHGLSIGSVGGKSDDAVQGVTFRDSTIVNSQDGCKIKTTSETTGSVDRVTHENIQ